MRGVGRVRRVGRVEHKGTPNARVGLAKRVKRVGRVGRVRFVRRVGRVERVERMGRVGRVGRVDREAHGAWCAPPPQQHT